MEQDDLTMENLLRLAKERKMGESIPFQSGMDEETAMSCRTNLFLRKFLGETNKETIAYGQLAQENHCLEDKLVDTLRNIGVSIVNTAVTGKHYGAWDSHYNRNLDWNVRTAITLVDLLGYKPAEIIKERKAELKECINHPLDGGDAYIAQAFAELGGDIPEGCKTVKDLAQSMKSERDKEIEKELEYFAAIPLTQDGKIDREEIFRQAMVRSVETYQSARTKLKPELVNYNRKSDVMYYAANLGLLGNLPEAEIKDCLVKIQSMKFD